MDTSILLYNLYNSNPEAFFKITLKNGEVHIGKIVSFFRENNNTIWQWRIANKNTLSSWINIDDDNSVLVKHKDISTVQIANDKIIHHL